MKNKQEASQAIVYAMPLGVDQANAIVDQLNDVERAQITLYYDTAEMARSFIKDGAAVAIQAVLHEAKQRIAEEAAQLAANPPASPPAPALDEALEAVDEAAKELEGKEIEETAEPVEQLGEGVPEPVKEIEPPKPAPAPKPAAPKAPAPKPPAK